MSKKKAVRVVSILWACSLLSAGFAFMTQLALARILEPENFGVFISALMMVMMFAPLAGFGIPQFWLKVFGKEGWNATRWLSPSFIFIVYSTMFVLIIIATWAMIGPHDQLLRNLLLILSLYVLGHISVELISAKFQLEESYIYFALWQIVPNLIRFIAVVILYYSFAGWMVIQNLAIVYSVIAVMLFLIACMQLNSMKRSTFQLKGHGIDDGAMEGEVLTPTVKATMSQSWPFGLAGLFVFIYMQSDIILINYITGSKEAGQYSVAFSIMSAVYLFPAVIYQKFLLPKIHRWANHDREKFFQVYRQGNKVMVFTGVIAMIVVYFFSDWGIPFLYGQEYSEAVIFLKILALCIPVYFLASSIGATLVTQNHMKIKVKYMGVVAIINLLLNVVFIPGYGAVGAAIATVLSNVILLSIYYVAFRKHVYKER